MNTELKQAELLRRLRSDFDRNFALPARSDADGSAEMLAFRVGEGCYAVDLGQVAAVHEVRAVTRVPGRRTGFEGVIAVQGQLVAVYDLGALIAAPGDAGSRRWLLVSRVERQLGFAVDAVDGYLRTSPSHLVTMPEQQQRCSAVRQAIDDGSAPRLIVDFAALLGSLKRTIEREAGNTR